MHGGIVHDDVDYDDDESENVCMHCLKNIRIKLV